MQCGPRSSRRRCPKTAASLACRSERSLTPPPPLPEQEPEFVYLSEEDWGTWQLGRPDFNPKKRRW